ncbi:urease accessory protein UreE [Chromobacterium haemolyticum]|uniref:Urease accessory protein UreE n=1 Tax=Chromobacterium haemolyticum TaxID=394935 RepID=A0A1W0D807_9NEIS|nr:urease accessory protein UreE [Chromobacterium haemolyticum]OQS43126.1 urease accessory protein UreE [Chromobacterium haemolyticum]
MLLLTRRAADASAWDDELLMSCELRGKRRLRTRSAAGEDCGLFLEPGPPLADGEVLQAEDGRRVRVVAAPEALLHVSCADAMALTRAAYHLGNRHVHLQVGDGWLRLLDDEVLARMLEQMGAQVRKIDAPFQPEAGAYGGGHHHSHGKEAAFQYPPRLHQYGAA